MNGLKFIGSPGDHIPGVPSKHMTSAELDALGLKADKLAKFKPSVFVAASDEEIEILNAEIAAAQAAAREMADQATQEV